jgi:putative esterase
MAKEEVNMGFERMRTIGSAAALAFLLATSARAGEPALKFEISFPSAVHSEPITGRVFLVITNHAEWEPRLQAGFWTDPPPLFGADVNSLKPGDAAIMDSTTPGYPVSSLREIPAGDYHVQAILNVYTEFHRSDGHVIWAHNDQWEGQQFNRSPGNLYSKDQVVHLDPAAGYDVKLNLTEVVPAVEIPPDTVWLKHLKFQSKLLSAFWGRPMYLGATVLLPRDYDAHPKVSYPVIYYQDHFSLGAPLPFSAEKPAQGSKSRWGSAAFEFYQAWISEHFPRLIAVRFQHPTPFFDDSYAVNSANNGPYGDALMTELIPTIESHYRIIPKPYARVLAGGSTGGWESLALQVYHPDFFGGTWTFFPDPVDFRRYDMVNIYDDDNAFVVPHSSWMKPERYIMRGADGQPLVSERQFSQLEEVLGSHGRSCQQLEAWESVYGPAGPDGYPEPVWDKRTGKIDHTVALYMRDHGYDLRYTLAEHWKEIGPQLTGKIHVHVGDMDNFYLNLAVYLLQESLEGRKDPYYAGSFEYGRPMKGHGWMPMSFEDLVRAMADEITKNAPSGEDTSAWKY